MRCMSFSATTPQVLARTKTVTRRLGWASLKAGEFVQAIEKGQGLKKGERARRLAVLRIASVRRERLDAIRETDVVLEGFPQLSRRSFVDMFRDLNGCGPDVEVTRIAFEYVRIACHQCGILFDVAFGVRSADGARAYCTYGCGAAASRNGRKPAAGPLVRVTPISDELHDRARRPVPLCLDHPRYQAIRQPRAECEACWGAWFDAELKRGRVLVAETGKPLRTEPGLEALR